MEVILFETVANLGVRGAICQVAPGYFRNFLSPRGMAVEATTSNIKGLQDKIKKLEHEAEEEVKAARSEAERLNEVTLNFNVKCGETGKLFGSVTNANVAEKLHDAGFEIDRHKIVIPLPIKDLGQHPILIKVHHAVTANVTIIVEPDEESLPAVERLAKEKAAATSEETAESEETQSEEAAATTEDSGTNEESKGEEAEETAEKTDEPQNVAEESKED